MTVEIGVTGNIGAGKSTVARAFARRGAVVIDADERAARVLADPQVVDELRAAFGAEVAPHGTVDRAALAQRVFGDEAARSRLEAIVHPRVRAAARDEVRSLRASDDPPTLVVHDVPLLYEAGTDREVDAVVFVDAPLDVRIERVTARSGLTREQVRERDAAQWPAAWKRSRADVVIDNAGPRERLDDQVEAAWIRVTGTEPPALTSSDTPAGG